MIADGGTKDLTYKQIGDALFPMASSVNAQVDKEMTHVRRRHARRQSGCVLQAAARHAARARLARRRFPPRQGRRHQRHQGRPARQQRRGTGQGSPLRNALSGHAVRALERRHRIVAGEDHARRREGVLQEPVQPVAADHRNRGRLFSGVPDGHEEGLPGAARQRRASSRGSSAPAAVEEIARRDRGQGHAQRRVLDRLSDRSDARRARIMRRCCWCRAISGSTA